MRERSRELAWENEKLEEMRRRLIFEND